MYFINAKYKDFHNNKGSIMSFYKFGILTTISIFILSSHGLTQEKIYQMRSKYNSFGNFYVVSAEGGGTLTFSDFQTPGISYLGRGGVEYFFPSRGIAVFGIRLFGGYGILTGKHDKGRSVGSGTTKVINTFKTTFSYVEGGIVAAFGKNNIIPYLAGGGNYVFAYSPGNQDFVGIYSPAGRGGFLSVFGEFGMRFFFTNTISLNISGKYTIGRVDDIDGFESNKNDSFFSTSAGISFHLFHSSRIR